MKHSAILAAVALSVGVAATTAQAEIETYGGVGLSVATYEEKGFSDDFSVTVLDFKAGAVINENLAAEARVGIGIDDDSTTEGGVESTYTLDNYYGLYLKPMLPAGEANLYAIAGFAKVSQTGEASYNGAHAESDIDASGLSWGLGAEFDLNSAMIGIEYTTLVDKSDYDVSAFGVSATFAF